jgi:hypothetical protein
MGHIDDYLRAQVTPQLGPGEQIMGMGHVRHPMQVNVIGVPERYEEWLATATGQRLILFRTESGGVLTTKPKPLCLEVKQWWYQELAQVTLGNVAGVGGGLFFGLVPHEPLGPFGGSAKRYDAFPNAEGLDGQQAFYGQFRTWLQQQVAAGAFPMDAERRALVEQHRIRKAAEAEAERQRAEQRRAQRQAAFGKIASGLRGPVLWLIGAVVLVLAAGGCLFNAYLEYDRIGFYEQMAKSSDESSKSIAYDKAEQKRQAGLAKEDRAKIPQLQLSAVIYGVAGVVLLLGSIALVVVWTKKRKAVRAQPAAGQLPAGQPPAGQPPAAPVGQPFGGMGMPG